MLENIKNELLKMKLSFESVSLMREKDGVTLARVKSEGKSFVIKYFDNEDFCREIENYKMLAELGIPTLKVFCTTQKAILMEDVSLSQNLRLGVKEDLQSVQSAILIAKWYKNLHQKGYECVAQKGCRFYDELDAFTRENIEKIKAGTDTGQLPFWQLIENNFDKLSEIIAGAKRTLTYNDFYYTNLAVDKGGSFALMFDYNFLGKGLAYFDIRNVTSSLSANAKKAFLKEYGAFDQREKIIDEALCDIIDLSLACQRNVFPGWAQEALTRVKEGRGINKIQQLLSLG